LEIFHPRKPEPFARDKRRGSRSLMVDERKVSSLLDCEEFIGIGVAWKSATRRPALFIERLQRARGKF